ncbi:MAG: acyl carrier protein [Planctomyces sp.]|nr:acyl carrier protein [Planctomyces sp.]
MHDDIRRFLTENSASGDRPEFADTDSLLELGVIDSVAMVDLIAFLERQYKIKVAEDDMTPENFDSVQAIVDYVSAKTV